MSQNMRMIKPKRIGQIQVVLGLVGLLLCGWLYFRYGEDMRSALVRADEVIIDATAQAEVGEAILDEWIRVSQQFDRTLEVHARSLQGVRTSSEMVGNSLERWQASLNGLSEVATDASLVSDKFAAMLPLRIPNLQVDTRTVDISIPEFELQQQSVKLPYPTASVGTRKTKLDLGLTEIELDVPTLRLGKANQIVTVPATPKVSRRTESFQVPADIQVTHQDFLSDEKSLLSDSGAELRSAADALRESSQTLDHVVRVLQTDLMSSLDETEDSLLHAQRMLQDSHQRELPEIRRRLQNQRDQVVQAQPVFERMQGFLPWLFCLLAFLPLTLLLQGCINIARDGQ